jgi:hypothetical protein
VLPRRLTSAEWLFLAAVVSFFAIFVVSRGEDRAWDFRNYHWYIPYAFLNGRMDRDIAVAHQATYYNPFLDIPFYYLATHFRAAIALAILGLAQGAVFVPLYLIARSIFIVPQPRLAAAIVTLTAMTGSLTLYLAGTTYYDNVMGGIVLGGLALVVTNRKRLAAGAPWQGASIAALGGLLAGSAVGLKLPEAPFALGFAAALAVLPGDLARRLSRLAAGGLGGIAGVALFAGYWFARMATLTGNPLFPYFNQYFHSPLALTASYRDMRFIPAHFTTQILYPILFSIDWRVSDDLPFHDVRVGLAYLLILAALPLAFVVRKDRTRLVDGDGALALLVFAAVSYLAWLRVFGIYRYILLLEIIAPLLVALCVAFWPLSARTRLTSCGVLFVVILVLTRAELPERAPLSEPYIQVTLPPIARPGQTMILMTGETPMGYLAPAFPAEIPVVRIDGWMIRPTDGSRLTARARARVGAFTGDLYVVFHQVEAMRNRDALKSYGLAIRADACRNIVTNLGGAYEFCPVERIKA